jgi:subtilase family serine protease
VTGLSIPYATGLALGSDVPIQITVRNHGTQSTVDAWELKLEFFSDPSFAAGDVITTMPAETQSFPTGLSADTTQVVTLNTTINLGVSPVLPDLVFVRAWIYALPDADDDDDVDVDGDNNAAFEVFQVLADGSVTGGTGTSVNQPDLTLDSVSIPPSVQRGETFDVVVVVANQGGADTPIGFDVTVEGFEDASYTVPLWPAQTLGQGTLAQTSSSDVTFQFTAASDDPLGTAYLRIRIDSLDWDTDDDREVVESNEGNNEWQTTTNITYPDTPDLTVDVTDGSSHFEIDNTSASMTISYTITNEGNTTAGACLAGYLLRGPLPERTWSQDLGKLTQIPAIAPGDTWDGSQSQWRVTTVPEVGRRYELVVVVDTGADVTEENENNNEGAREVLIYSNASADLTASVISVTGSVNFTGGGRQITIQYRIDNDGTGDAGQSMTHLELRRKSDDAWVTGWLTTPIGSIPPGGYHEEAKTVWFDSVPELDVTYYIKVVADGNLEVAETEEENNTAMSGDILIF